MNDPLFQIVGLLDILLDGLMLAIIARAVLSWIRPNPGNPLVQLVLRVTDPIMRPLQNIIPSFGGLDISPIIAIVILQMIQGMLPALLSNY